MLIIKGGISREIDEKSLQVYTDKGYTPVGVVNEYNENVDEPIKTENESNNKEKPLSKMTTKELEEKALELEVNISDCKNNAERVERIQGAINVAQEKGE